MELGTSPPESADDLRKTHFASLRRAIAGCDGTEVKVVGDGVMAVVHAWTAIRLRAADHAERLFELLAPHRQQIAFDGVEVFEPVATYLGALAWLVGRIGDAEDLFAEGLALAQSGGMKYAQAQTQLLWGSMIASDQRACDRDRARPMLEAAHDLALAHSYAAIERQSALLLQTGQLEAG